MSMGGALDGLSAIALGGYVTAVIFHGNLNPLLDDVVKQRGYGDFVIAAGTLWGIAEWKPGEPVIGALIIGGLVAIVIKVASNRQSIAGAFQSFADGQTDIFGLLAQLFGGP